MYEAFFGLRSRPFSPLPRVDTYIPLAPLREPLESLVRCIAQEQGIGVLTAPQGAGKSLVCRMLQYHFRELRRTVLLTTARFPTRRALLQAILFELKHPYVGLSEQEARLRVLDLLQASPNPLNRMLLIVDEAHLLSPRGLEELRTLTDYEIGGIPCVSLVLSGQLELEELLTDPAMNALNQRVGCHVCIEPLTFEESAQYLRERLRLAGNDGLTLFTPEAIQLICSASEGNPRRLNQLCDHSLLLAFAEEERPIDLPTVRAALLDLRELPLHWNAPLDLAGGPDRNPLEVFAETHEAELAALLEEPLSECDTDIDLEEDSAFEFGDSDGLSDSESSVYEVGSSHVESPFEQLFQVSKFVVPGESRGSDETTPSAPQMELLESHAFETAPPEAQTEEATVFETDLPGQGFEVGGELVRGDSPSISAIMPPPRQSEFEELAVDDVYALIDRLREASSSSRSPLVRKTPQAVVPPALEETPTAHASEFPLEEIESVDDLDDTLFDDALARSMAEATVTFDPPASEFEPVMLESQLLDFINEISLDVRQFREELHTSDVDSGCDATAKLNPSVEKAHRAEHHSLRQTLNWQFDIVEPEAVGHSVEQSNSELEIEEYPAVVNVASEPASAVAPTAETEATPTEERRYAQLFTRLQRQRRRVEAVMNRERRTGAEAR